MDWNAYAQCTLCKEDTVDDRHKHPMQRARLIRALFIALLLLLALGISVGAAADQALGGKLRAGGTVTVPASETVHSDLYIAGGTIQVDGNVEGDLLVAGGTVNVNGKINGSIMAAGGNLTVNGATGGSIRAAGGTITVGGSAGRDVVAAGGQLNLSPASHVTGDVVFTGGQLTLDGTVQGNVLGSTSTYTKNGTVAGTENVTIQQHREQPSQPWGAVGGIRTLVVRYVGVLLFGLLLLWLVPRGMAAIATTVDRRPLPSLGVGALGILGIIAVCIGAIILALVLAIPLGLLGFGLLSGFTVVGMIVFLIGFAFAVAFFMVFLADAWVGYALGRLILERVQSSWAKKPVWAFLIGATIVVLLTAIPIVGGLFKFAVILLALGGFVLALWRWRHPLPISQAVTGGTAPAVTLPSATAT
jgi:cytoskeletal protein CcmA (bactofilin family)